MKRSCSGTTKKGEACKAPPLSGHDFCMAHAPAKIREAAGFIAKNGKQGRKPIKPLAALRERVESEIDKWLEPYEQALTATAGIVVGTGPNARLEVLPDYKLRMAASNAVLDRVYGRPKQAMELTGEGGGPIETRELIPSDVDFQTETARVLEEAGALTASDSDTD